MGGPDPYGDTPADYAAYYAEEHGATSATAFVTGLAAVLFLWAVGRIAGVVAGGRDARAGLHRLAIFGAGVLFATALIGAAAADVAMSNAVNTVDGFEPDAQVAIALDLVVDSFYIVGMLAAGALAWAVAVAGRQSGRLSGWMAWAGFVLAPLAAFGWELLLLPLALALVWLVAVSMMTMTSTAD